MRIEVKESSKSKPITDFPSVLVKSYSVVLGNKDTHIEKTIPVMVKIPFGTTLDFVIMLSEEDFSILPDVIDIFQGTLILTDVDEEGKEEVFTGRSHFQNIPFNAAWMRDSHATMDIIHSIKF